jgi:hypothetical protein
LRPAGDPYDDPGHTEVLADALCGGKQVVGGCGVAHKEVGSEGVAMAEYSAGSWDGMGAQVNYTDSGVRGLGGMEKKMIAVQDLHTGVVTFHTGATLTANEKAAQEAISSYSKGPGPVVTFHTGATRSTENQFDPEGFISPAVLASFSDYMTKHRIQKDGQVRASDNWQKGMPTSRAYRSLTRHFLDLWLLKRGYPAKSADCGSPEDALHAILFNVMVILKNRIDNNHHEATP